jgi:hypothetical protein
MASVIFSVFFGQLKGYEAQRSQNDAKDLLGL